MNTQDQNMDMAQKMMLLQGITLINDGLQFIEWAEDMPSDLSYDLIEIVRERFKVFQKCVLNGEQDYLIIDRVKKHMENVKHGYKLNQQIQKQLKELREHSRRKQHQVK